MEEDASLGQFFVTEDLNRKVCLAHEKGGFGYNEELAIWGQRARNIAGINST